MAKAPSRSEDMPGALEATKDRIVKVVRPSKDKVVQVASSRCVQVTAASAAGGAALGGAGGAVAGLLSGGALGAAAGILPALFTFGLSIPVGAMLGGSCGLAVGVAAGSSTGFVGGGAVGYGAYTKRVEIRGAVVGARVKLTRSCRKAKEVAVFAFAKGRAKVIDSSLKIKGRVLPLLAASKRKVEDFLTLVGSKVGRTAAATKTKTLEIASQRSAQVTAASAAGGVVVGATGGAATGLLTGGALGAAVGVVPAIFTFGLSIPFCAVLGGGCGLAAGTVVGGSAGAVVGGASGYGIYSKRELISTTANGAATSVKKMASNVRAKFTAARG